MATRSSALSRSLATGYLVFYFAILAVAAAVNLQLPPSALLYASIVVLAMSIAAVYNVFAARGYYFLAAFITLWSALAIMQLFMGFTIALADLAISLIAGLSLYTTRARYRGRRGRELPAKRPRQGSFPDDFQRPAA
ncbi:MAG: hypothetical protein A2X94_10900 [Bdellovibrionales bacterium GWB1_55_8]|nr:MAG: hypothetical protein A2X94_10900 [Bdellovibrionales bacterium GWB1_55_8]